MVILSRAVWAYPYLSICTFRLHSTIFFQLLTAAGISATHTYSSLDQTARKINVAKFVNKKASVMIVTDLAVSAWKTVIIDYTGYFTDCVQCGSNAYTIVIVKSASIETCTVTPAYSGHPCYKQTQGCCK